MSSSNRPEVFDPKRLETLGIIEQTMDGEVQVGRTRPGATQRDGV